MAICDSCGATVDAEHVRRRIMRLELATRYRPVHIQTLIVGDAPPESQADEVYACAERAEQLQKAGVFLVYAVECPVTERSNAVQRAAETLVKRVKLSYKPKSIVLFSQATAELIPALHSAGLSELLVLSDGKPFETLPDLQVRCD